MNRADLQGRINKDWTLFLDRDGVLNVEQKGSYITQWSDFKFYEGVLESLAQLKTVFGRIVIVTNQRGVSRGVMSLEDLKQIHNNMCAEVEQAGGYINKIYACTALNDDDHNRKPNTGMATQAQQDFPEIDFSRSVMVGNNLSDMQFGKKMGMYTVFLPTTQDPISLPHDLIDDQYDAFSSWSSELLAELV